MKKIKLGQEVRDKVSGFTGVTVARCKYLNGCVQFHVTPEVDSNGNVRKDEWIDAVQLEVIGDGVYEKKIKASDETDETDEPKYSGGGGFRSHPGE